LLITCIHSEHFRINL